MLSRDERDGLGWDESEGFATRGSAGTARRAHRRGAGVVRWRHLSVLVLVLFLCPLLALGRDERTLTAHSLDDRRGGVGRGKADCQVEL
jgi:hypothetical protein